MIKFNKKAMTLIEIIIAVGILGIALIPIIGMINNNIKRAYSFGGTRDYADRAANIMEDLLEKVSYREIQRFNPVTNSELNERVANVVEDLSQIRTIYIKNTAEGAAKGAAYNPEDYGLLIKIESDNIKKPDSSVDTFFTNSEKTFFRYKNVEYFFKLEITNIPLEMAFKRFLPQPAEIIKERIFTRDRADLQRDMFKKLIIYVDWKEWNRPQQYSLVSFKANIETAFDNE
ncbi:MAG: prepilin-type N-terminal cleavage/methylation domain-containing protein [Candidatus Muirbacterium halophilum]|nr:prepilin-type N-terminal cleavage/methylation domain-containing protein [Candidatus Muirbacterium halophilum]MCK9474401.1 prepilin-type N-terminal cleavage/methylation domain-containing protein [Candidatus Muirbacterium halophilum]